VAKLLLILTVAVSFGFGAAIRLVDFESRVLLLILAFFGFCVADLVLRAYVDLGNPRG
jgi:hypothetical protein